MSRSIAVLMLVLCSAASGAQPPIEAQFNDLVKNPQKYSGKRVSVRAYVVTSCTHCGEFWPSVEAARDSRVHAPEILPCIAIGGYRGGYRLPDWFARRLDSQDYDGYVRVVGRFEYVQKYRSNRMVDGYHGFGWSHLDDKQITDITELCPLGPPIPAHIN
jgi:hypothetical protein